MRRSIWSELVPYERLVAPEVIAMLAARQIELCVAVTPGEVEGLPRVVQRVRDAGIRVVVWPMLAHADGRWPSPENSARFEAFTARVLARLAREGVAPDGVAIDLEPSIAELPGLLALETRAIRQRLRHRPPPGSVERLARLCRTLEAGGAEVMVAAVPFVVSDGPRGGWQRFLGTPVDALGVRRVTAMIYTSMIEGYARGRLARRDARALLYGWARAMRARYPSPSISLGCVGRGILESEPTYRDPSELAADVAACRAAGIDDLILFSLCGALSRSPAEPWLDAFVETDPARAVPMTPRARALLAVTRALSLALGRGYPLR